MRSLARVLVLVALTGCGGQERATPTVADSTTSDLAAAWVRSYYKAIDERRYQEAYAHWARGGSASGKTFEEFQRGFERTTGVEAKVGTPGPVEGAAGSRYVEVPVTITARDQDGTKKSYGGSYTLRLSVVDGATPEQRTWHIDSAVMRPLE